MPPARSAQSVPRRSRSPQRTTQRQQQSPARPRRVAHRGPRGRVRWDRVGRVGLLVVLGVVAALYVQHALSYFSTKAQADQQQAIVNRLTKENAALTREQKSLGDPAVIQQDARQLGMVKAGERPYVVMGLPRH